MSQFTYEPVNTSCVNVYKDLYGDELNWASDSKNKRKALAFMNTGQGRSDVGNPFGVVNSCVYPKEAKGTMKLNGSCMMMNSDTNSVVDANYEPTTDGLLDIDNQVREQQIRDGKGVYPSQGCSVATFDKDLLKSATNSSKDILNAENNKELQCLQGQINATIAEINDLINVKVPRQQQLLNNAIYNYNVTLNNCNYHDWWQRWFMQYGKPWANSYLSGLQNYLNWLRNDYWHAVNNYGKWRASMCNSRNRGFKNDSRGPGNWNYCMDVYGYSRENGGRVVGWDCHGDVNQQWEIVNDGHYGSKIVSKLTGKCLDVYGWGTADGTGLVQWDCHGGTNQRFVTTGNGDLRPVHTHVRGLNKCIDPAGVGENGGQLVVWPCQRNGAYRYQDQKFKYTGVGGNRNFNMQNI